MLSIGPSGADPSLEMRGESGPDRGRDEGSRPGVRAAYLQVRAPQVYRGVEVRSEGKPLRQWPIESHARTGRDEQARGRVRVRDAGALAVQPAQNADRAERRLAVARTRNERGLERPGAHAAGGDLAR